MSAKGLAIALVLVNTLLMSLYLSINELLGPTNLTIALVKNLIYD